MITRRPDLDVPARTVRPVWAFLFVLLALLAGCQSAPTLTPRDVLTPDEYAEDLDVVQATLQEVHIGAWPDKAAQEDVLERLRRLKQQQFWLSRPLELYRHLAPVVSSLNEVHTRLEIPETALPQTMVTGQAFPLALVMEKNRTLVAADLSGQAFVPVGSEVMAINGVPMARIRASLLPYVSAETESGRRRLLQVRFGRLLSEAMGMQPPYTITWRLGYGLQTVKMDAIESRQGSAVGQISDGDPWTSWRLDDGSVVLGVHHFDARPEAFRQFCRTFFSQLAKHPPPRLVLDLRYNPGGLSDNIMTLLSHLTDEPLSWAQTIEIRNSQPFRSWFQSVAERKREQLLGRYLRWIPLEYLEDWPWKLLLARDGEVTRLSLGKWERADEGVKAYDGPLAVLVNGYCFSGCAYLVDELQHSGRAVVVGESPGSQAGIQLGLPVRVTLPNSGLILQVPAARIIKQARRYPIAPDVEVERTGEDLANQRDPELAAALDILDSLAR